MTQYVDQDELVAWVKREADKAHDTYDQAAHELVKALKATARANGLSLRNLKRPTRKQTRTNGND